MQEGLLSRLDPRAKIVAFLTFTVVVVTTPGTAVWAFVLYAAVLVFLAGLGRVPLRALLRRLALVLPLLVAVAVFLPFAGDPGAAPGVREGPLTFQMTSHDLGILWNTGAKATLSVLSVSLLGLTTPLPRLLAGFQALRAPRLIVLIVGFMARYGALFVDESRRSQRALTARNFRARWLGNVPVFGHMLGALFLRSYSRGERVYLAMVSRGYDGTMPQPTPLRLLPVDVAFAAGTVVIVITVRLLTTV
jgi:cobalt/nickel transport system permease protein